VRHPLGGRGARGYSRRVPGNDQRREQLKEVWAQARTCVRCPELAQSRHTVVFGAGNADADLMFVGEAPGANEDRRGLPFVGQAGALLERLLAEIGLRREDVFIANVLKCRPPGNRDPLPQEIENCRQYLFRQLELVRPTLVCTLGNFSTKLLRADAGTGITRLHGRLEERVVGPLAVRLYPLFHPAAALYTPAMAATLRSDFSRIPELLALPALEQPQPDRVGLAVTQAGPMAAQPTAPEPGDGGGRAPVASEPGRDVGGPARAACPATEVGVGSSDEAGAPGLPGQEAQRPPDSAQLGLF
jgi:uracil-DNA glycosylase family 4